MAFVVVSLRNLHPAPFYAARLFLLAKDTTIVNAVNERFGLADRAYVAERKHKTHMAKLELGQTTPSTMSAASLDCPNTPSPQRGSGSSRLAECGVEHTRLRASDASGPAAEIVFRVLHCACGGSK